ncbi:response regulator transcription factor [Candidatus Acetothermia bacterium]|nr:response regulator transcription factor [Candidatus Acetothermia bacterium]MBI3460765.1 response regulator transcription factor [Candidatus Acetothermia bacterium]MBI3661276.1 response regulator transcription factor [Candidatus Acetothermia bacterium]
MSKRILVVEDDREIAILVRDYLVRAGFHIDVAYTGIQALDLYQRNKPSLIVLDLMLPEIDGLDIARRVRKDSDIPIIVLTARSSEADRVSGLELGADDYISKPFSPRELVARVRAVLRRSEGGGLKPAVIHVGPVVIDLERHAVAVHGRPIELTPTEFDLLSFLAQHPGRVYTRLQLLEHVQGSTHESFERTIDAHIKNLRHKIEADPKNPDYIMTVHGVGYKFQGAQK